jgi:DNA-binding response OmpR family regulator
MAKVLLIGFPPKDEKKVASYFHSVEVETVSLPSMEVAMQKLAADPPTVIVADRPDRLESIHGLREVLRQNAPATPFLIVLPEPSIDLALPALRAGAYDCLARPLDRAQVLAAAKRAAGRHGRTLFVPKIKPRPRRTGLVAAALTSFILTATLLGVSRRASPAPTLDLGSATLSGIQWHGRELWVGNWFDSTITLYEVGRSMMGKSSRLVTREVFKLAETQPILVCETKKDFVTIGFDLLLRSHRRTPGLPTARVEKAPASNPTGLAWDGKNLWSCDSSTGLLYRHGADLKVVDSVRSIIPEPVGMAGDRGLWVIGGSPLKVARLTRSGKGYVWSGPYPAGELMPEGVSPSGLAVGHGRLWAVGGGDPAMTSVPLKLFRGAPALWKNQGHP